MADSSESQAETFPQLLLQRLQHDAERPAMREKAYGIWQTWTLDFENFKISKKYEKI